MKYLQITIAYPDGVLMSEIKSYASEALEVWGGQRSPDDPLFHGVKAPKSKMKAVGNVPRKPKSDRIA